jgi:hypothetical protein
MKPITRESSREDVLAAVEEHERRASAAKRYADDDFDFRGDPPGRREGCYWSKDGAVVACYRGGPKDEPYHVIAQRRAGEEDQSDTAPAWGA